MNREDYGDDKALAGFAKVVDKNFVKVDNLLDEQSNQKRRRK